MGGWRRPGGGDSEYAVGADKRGGGWDGGEDPLHGSGKENKGTKDGIECHDDESDMDVDESTIMDNSSSMIPHDDNQEAEVRNVDDDDEKEGELSSIRTTTASRAGRDTPSPDDALPHLAVSSSSSSLSSSDVDPASMDVQVEGPSMETAAGRGKEDHRDDDDDDDDGRTSRRRAAAPFAAGMPSSDDDPRVLEARRRLWTAIDAALANYSLEIIAMGV